MPARTIRTILAVGLFLAPLAFGCKPAAPGSVVVAELGRGTLNGQVYTNDYFKLTVKVPDGWYVQNQDEMAELQKMGRQMVQGSDPNFKKAVDQAQSRTLNLLTAFEQPPGTPMLSYNTNFLVMTERVKHLPGVKSGAEYCEQLKKALNMTAMKYDFDPVESGHKIGSLNAHCLPLHLNFNGMKIHQRYYCTRYKDYVLAVILSYATDEQRQSLEGTLASIKAGAD